ncbi:MAG: DUF1877 family protein [Planctomycetota bacterium]
MSTLGVHVALNDDELKRVLEAPDPDSLLEFVREVVEDAGVEGDEWSHHTETSWNAIHRCLTNGRLEYEAGPWPLAYGVLGGQHLYGGDRDDVVMLVLPDQVAEAAQALGGVSKDWLREKYFGMDAEACGFALKEAHFEDTWENFSGLPGFFTRAAAAGRAVIFASKEGDREEEE